MKKFIISILCVAVFFIGLGNLVEQTGARFKSDEKALALIKQAQIAIGGEEAIRNVKSFSINGTVTKNFDFDGVARTEQGDLEINLQLPNQFAKMMKLRREDNSNGEKTTEIKKEVNVIVMRQGEGDAPILRQSDPNAPKQDVMIVRKNKDGNVVFGGENTGIINGGEVRKIVVNKDGSGVNFHQNELFRTTLALLLTAPQGTDVTFTYIGDGDVDGNSCDVVEAQSGTSSIKLFLDKSTHLPRMMSYQGFKPMVFKVNKDEARSGGADTKVLVNRLANPEPAEIQVKFSDYRTVNGVLLPYSWTQTNGGNADETVNVASYEINPANIAEKFQNLPPKVMIRSEKKTQ
jgi:hypothetical protein